MVKTSVVARKDDPDYMLISGYVPKEVAVEFKVFCASKQKLHADALEEALRQWLKSQQLLEQLEVNK